MDNIRPTSHAAVAHPAPVKKPTQNQTPIRYRLTVEGILNSPDSDDDQYDNKKWARAMSGNATAPPMSVMNSRRFMSTPEDQNVAV